MDWSGLSWIGYEANDVALCNGFFQWQMCRYKRLTPDKCWRWHKVCKLKMPHTLSLSVTAFCAYKSNNTWLSCRSFPSHWTDEVQVCQTLSSGNKTDAGSTRVSHSFWSKYVCQWIDLNLIDIGNKENDGALCNGIFNWKWADMTDLLLTNDVVETKQID